MISDSQDMAQRVREAGAKADATGQCSDLAEISRVAADVSLGPSSVWPHRIERYVRYINACDMYVTSVSKLVLAIDSINGLVGKLKLRYPDFWKETPVDFLAFGTITAIFVYPIARNRYEFIGKVAWVGIVAMLSLVSSILCVCALWASREENWQAPKDFSLLPHSPSEGWHAVGTPIATLVFSYAIASSFPLVKTDMQKPQYAGSSNTIAHLGSTLIFLLFGVSIYVMVDKTTEYVYTDERFSSEEGFYYWAIVSAFISSYPSFILFFTPVVQTLETLFFSSFQNRFWPHRRGRGVFALPVPIFRVIFLVGTIILGLVLSKYHLFSVVQAISGAYFVTLTCLLVPALSFWPLYLNQSKFTLSKGVLLGRLFITGASAITFLVCLTIGTFDIHEEAKRKIR